MRFMTTIEAVVALKTDAGHDALPYAHMFSVVILIARRSSMVMENHPRTPATVNCTTV